MNQDIMNQNRDEAIEIKEIYQQMGIREEVLDFCLRIENRLAERFAEIDRRAEINQLTG